MIRNLKVLGLAMMAVSAFGAIAASGASAATNEIVRESGAGAFTLTGEETGAETANRLTAFGSRVQCPGSTYKATVSGSTATVTPKYINCVASALKFPSTVDMNGCTYVLHLGNTISAGTYAVQSTLSCPGTGPVVTIFKKEGDPTHPESELKCVLEVDPNVNGYTGLHLVDTTNGFVDLTGEATGIQVTQHAGPLGGCLSAATEDANGKLDVDLTIDGHNNAGEGTIGVKVQETP